MVVATGTIALQEQLIHKDLPELLEACGWDHSCALVKGRGRYACNLKMEQCLDAVKSKEAGLFLFEDEVAFNPNQHTEGLYKEMSEALAEGTWDGDRDSWETRIQDVEWRALTIDRRQCTGRRCRFVNQCAFFNARNELEESECIVANHDLVMADLALGGGAILPPPEDCIYIFDEGHRLGDTAIRHFGAECRVNNSITFLERLQKQIKGQGPLFEKDSALTEQLPRIEKEAGNIIELLSVAYPLLQQSLESADYPEDGRYRYAHGDVGAGIRDIAKQLAHKTSGWLGRLEVLVDTLNDALGDKQYPVPVPDIEMFYQQAGSWQSRAEQLLALWDRLHRELKKGEMPMACWLRLDDSGGNIDISVNASPIQAAELLSDRLWGSCYGAVLTSATLKALGNFETLKRETGVPDFASFMSVAGAFNYGEAAVIRVPADAVEGNSVDAHSSYIVDNFPSLVEKRCGTLGAVFIKASDGAGF